MRSRTTPPCILRSRIEVAEGTPRGTGASSPSGCDGEGTVGAESRAAAIP